MLDTLADYLRIPLVAFAWLVEGLRRLPGAPRIERHSTLVVAALMVAATVVFGVWMAQRSPERVTMAQLAQGSLSSMQSWIIITGDVSATTSGSGDVRYSLTDPAVPDARLIVITDMALPVGHTTVSGTLLGGASGQQADFAWIGQLRADPVLATEPDPPWAAVSLAGLGLLIAAGHRTTYPLFFHRRPTPGLRPGALDVVVQRDWPQAAEIPARGTLLIPPDAPIELRLPGETARVLRLHSVHSSLEVGELRWLSRSEPAMLLRPATGDLRLSFASAADRDAAFAALMADAKLGASTRP